ncbi:MAG: sulfatase-like hydrolase/transferase [Limnochordia bacterium]|jgi:arylsulfatase A-like enzyme
MGSEALLRGLMKKVVTFTLAAAAATQLSHVTFAKELDFARPNIVFVLADDMGWGDLACYGNQKAHTPHIDRLAAEGIRFEQFYAASPVCSPSRVGATTGMYPERWRIRSFLQTQFNNYMLGQANYLDPNAPTLARTLRNAGYATAHFGKWHMGGGRDVYDAPLPSAYGFDEHRVNIEGLGPRFAQVPGNSNFAVSTADVVDATLDFLKRHPDQPCYVNLWPSDVHTPHVPTEATRAKYAALGYNLQRQNFYGNLEEFDQQIGRFLKGLDELGIAEKTLVIFVGDNGPLPLLAGERTGSMRGGKGSLYEGGIRVPGIVRWKGRIEPGQVNTQTVFSTLDLLPSLCAIAEVALPAGVTFDGEDLSAALLGEQLRRTHPLFWEYGHMQDYYPRPPSATDQSPTLAVRDGDWKLLVNTDGSGAELYNIGSSRFEFRDLAGDYPEITARLSQMVRDWYAEVRH